MLTFCTLFDSNYLDKGLALYDSMQRVMEDFRLYILAMDDVCCQILKSRRLANVEVISLQEFEDEELLKIRAERTRAEYCWTCTASLIEYVLAHKGETFCTYVDADLYFYQNPKLLIEEMAEAGCSVQIVRHGFGSGILAQEKEKAAGKYCVQFNTFRNDSEGRRILKTWNAQCREHCSMEPGEMGDQKYLSDWAEKYEKVHVLTHPGAGVAPWNLFRFRKTDTPGWLKDKKTKETFALVFYHFHHLEYLEDSLVNLNVFKKELGAQKELVYEIYAPYLKKLEEIKQQLAKEYDMTPVIRKHPGLKARSRKEKLAALFGMRPAQLYYKLRDKLAYTAGKKKDILNLEEVL